MKSTRMFWLADTLQNIERTNKQANKIYNAS